MGSLFWFVMVSACLAFCRGQETITDVRYVETKFLPVYLSCEKRYGFIDVGGVTMNSAIMPVKAERYAKQECEDQLQDPLRLLHESRTACHLTFGNKFEKNQSDIIRVIYRCFDAKPPKSPSWGGEKGAVLTETAEQTTPGEDVIMQCNRNKAMIVVTSSYINGVPVNTGVFTSLDPYKLQVECFGQWIKILQDPAADKSQTTCRIPNKASYGGSLKIDFKCTVAKNIKQREKLYPASSTTPTTPITMPTSPTTKPTTEGRGGAKTSDE